MKKQTKDAFYVIGIPMRTTNENGQSIQDIGKHWEKFFQEGFYDKIPNKKGNELIAVYSDYELDYTKPYTYTLGCEVASLADMPAGFIGKSIPPAKYAVYEARGKFPHCLGQTWQEIWNSQLNRAYKIDFEIYAPGAIDPVNSHIPIWIGIEE